MAVVAVGLSHLPDVYHYPRRPKPRPISRRREHACCPNDPNMLTRGDEAKPCPHPGEAGLRSSRSEEYTLETRQVTDPPAQRQRIVDKDNRR